MLHNRNTDGRSSVAGFTLADLVRMHGGDAPIHDCVVANSGSHLEVFRDPVHIDAFILGVMTRGQAVIRCNMQEYTLSQDMCFLVGPHSLVQTVSTTPFNCYAIVISAELVQRINVDTKRLLPIFLRSGLRSCFPLAHEQAESLCNAISVIERELREPESEFSHDILGNLIGALLYKLAVVLRSRTETTPRSQSRAEEYLHRFIDLLGEHFRTERRVGFYARELCLTPKYLTTVIRSVSGKSVQEWVDLYVIMEAKIQLRYSDRSIQEIAYLLNFPNQSFFGSYFRRLTGMSPTQFRNSEG